MARATSIVRYAPGSRFDPHVHELGEEFPVLEGVFSDESGAFGAGMYVRNPPGSRHRPHSESGCSIFVKLRRFDLRDDRVVRVDARRGAWQAAAPDGLALMPLFERGSEQVLLQRLAPGTRPVPPVFAPTARTDGPHRARESRRLVGFSQAAVAARRAGRQR